ncbi:MAG TPA: hypothetical protein G4O14_11530 [Anaerolineae bacterium]|nr:hypothetical protein [Anaerolineae bacterium]
MTNLSVIIPMISALFFLSILAYNKAKQVGSSAIRIPVRIESESPPRQIKVRYRRDQDW